jgi:hypothetical protein
VKNLDAKHGWERAKKPFKIKSISSLVIPNPLRSFQKDRTGWLFSNQELVIPKSRRCWLLLKAEKVSGGSQRIQGQTPPNLGHALLI